MEAQMGVLGLILFSYPYLRSEALRQNHVDKVQQNSDSFFTKFALKLQSLRVCRSLYLIFHRICL